MNDRDELAGLMKAHSDAAPLGTFKWRALSVIVLGALCITMAVLCAVAVAGVING